MTPPYVRQADGALEFCIGLSPTEAQAGTRFVRRRLSAIGALFLAETILREANRLLAEECVPRNQTGD